MQVSACSADWTQASLNNWCVVGKLVGGLPATVQARVVEREHWQISLYASFSTSIVRHRHSYRAGKYQLVGALLSVGTDWWLPSVLLVEY